MLRCHLSPSRPLSSTQTSCLYLISQYIVRRSLARHLILRRNPSSCLICLLEARLSRCRRNNLIFQALSLRRNRPVLSCPLLNRQALSFPLRLLSLRVPSTRLPVLRLPIATLSI